MKMNHGGVAIWTILVLNRSAAHFRLRKLNLSTPPPPPPHAKNIRSPLGLSGLSHRMPVRVCQCHLLARPCRLNVDINSLDLPLFSVRRIFNLLWVNDWYLTFQFKNHVNKSILNAKYFAILLPDSWCLSVAIFMILSGDKSRHNCILGITYIATS